MDGVLNYPMYPPETPSLKTQEAILISKVTFPSSGLSAPRLAA